jgi:hypothetical protein
VSATIDECACVIWAEGFPPPAEVRALTAGLYSQPESTYAPSMLIDMEEGRPTEGEHTICDLGDRAARRGIGAPAMSESGQTRPSWRFAFMSASTLGEDVIRFAYFFLKVPEPDNATRPDADGTIPSRRRSLKSRSTGLAGPHARPEQDLVPR